MGDRHCTTQNNLHQSSGASESVARSDDGVNIR
jgi:hypothetical protein